MELLTLFSLIVKYNLPFTNKTRCVSDIQQWFMASGSVWQKFAQVLSQYEEVVGNDLALALGKMCFDCPAHDDIYSARIIKDAFGDKYDTKTMVIVGSGTISQVYKVYDKSSSKFVAIKVMHPNVKREIRDACEAYNNIKSSYLFPSRLNTILSLFFTGLKEQLLMNKEYKNGKLFKKSLQPKSNGNFLFVIPEMIEYSKKCLVMEYEESLLFAKIDIDRLNDIEKHKFHDACNAVLMITMTFTKNGVLHGDLHFGNVGIQKFDSTMKIVIYDLGQCFDITTTTIHTRAKWVKSFMCKNTTEFVVSAMPEKIHSEILPKMTTDFDDNIRIMGKYILLNNIQVDKNVMNAIASWSKLKKNAETILSLNRILGCDYHSNFSQENGIQEYLDKYLPYDEFECLRKL